MPIPKPTKGEKQSDFIGRCMGDDVMRSEYPEREQRAAVCYSSFRRSKKQKNQAEEGDSSSYNFFGWKANKYYTRSSQMDGRDFVVVPVVLLTEGVHNGSAGAKFYPAEELEKFPEAWNGRPVPVYHPTSPDGHPISANRPDVIETRTVGYLFNVGYRDGKLSGEIWVDVLRADAVEPGLLDMLRMGREIEVSTGLWSDDEHVEGEWNGEHYDSVVRNIRPDHLAILPSQRGACSLADGCGIRANSAGCGDGCSGCEGKKGLVAEKIFAIVNAGKVSHDAIRTQLQRYVDKKDVRSDTAPMLHYVVEVFDDYFVYARQSKDGEGLLKQSYTVDNRKGEVNIDEEVKEVVRETSYREKSIKENNERKEETVMNREQKIEAIVNGGVEIEGGREALDKLSDSLVDFIHNAVVAKAELKAAAEKASQEEKEKAPEAPEANQEVKEVTYEELLAKAPAEVREMLQTQAETHKTVRANLIKKLVENKCLFSEEQMQKMNIDDLRKMVTMFGADADDVSFAANAGEKVAKSGAGEPLPEPSLNWYAPEKKE